MKLFVTGTGTDIGKTYVSCGLLRLWRARGVAARALKPVLSGYDAAGFAQSDSAALLGALGQAVSSDAIAAISPWRYAAPLSPDWAARREGKVIDVDVVSAFCASAIARDGPLLIEGVGGVMVPLDGRLTMLDLMRRLDLPVLLVVGSYLGTLSHTLTALAVLRAVGLRCTVVVNTSAGDGPDPAETRDAIARCGDVRTLVLPRGAGDLDFAAVLDGGIMTQS